MTLKPADIDFAYRLILGRRPSDADVANIASQCTTEAALRNVLLSSEEFYRKFRTLRVDFEAKQAPILVHMDIPGTTEPSLLDALAAAPDLQPAARLDAVDFKKLCALPRPERIRMRYVQGDLALDAADALDLPFLRICVLRRPDARIHRIYRAACAADPDADMAFGRYLELSLDTVPLRLELDNGQVRRLAGVTGQNGLGREDALLRHALHTALGHDMILGLAERPEALVQSLAAEMDADLAYAAMTAPDDADAHGDAALETDLAGLSAKARRILGGYTGWDDYLYAVCDALLFPNSSARET